MSELSWSLETRLREGRTNGTALKWTVTPIHVEAAEALTAKDSALTAEREKIAELERERDEARGIVRDTHWMAVRYADNRKSYAVGMCNDALRKAYDGGWLVYKDDKQHDLDPQYARDGMFDVEWRSEVDAANTRAEAAEAKLAEAEKVLEPFAGAEDNEKYPDAEPLTGYWADVLNSGGNAVTFGHLRAAHAFLAGEQKPSVPPDVSRLVVAARLLLEAEGQDRELLRELDMAADAFSSRVPYDDDPTIEEDDA